jgi:hypothetical protein
VSDGANFWCALQILSFAVSEVSLAGGVWRLSGVVSVGCWVRRRG